MRKIFLASCLFLSIAFVVQIKWGNALGIPGVPLIAGSLAALGAVLEWYEILFLSLAASYVLQWQPGISLEQALLFIVPFAAWALRHPMYSHQAGSFARVMRKETAAAAIGASGALLLAIVSSAPGVHADVPKYATLLAVSTAAAGAWSFFQLALTSAFDE